MKHDYTFKNELNGGVTILRGLPLGEYDEGADTFTVNVTKAGAAADLSSCGCEAYFVRPDGATVTLAGSISSSAAQVTLSAACYLHPGEYSLAIKLTGTNNAVTLCLIYGYIARTRTGAAADEDSLLPGVAELMDALEALEARVEALED